MEPANKAILKRIGGVVIIFVALLGTIAYYRLNHFEGLEMFGIGDDSGGEASTYLPDYSSFDTNDEMLDSYFQYLSNVNITECDDLTFQESVTIVQGTWHILSLADQGLMTEAEVNESVIHSGLDMVEWWSLYTCAFNVTGAQFEDGDFNPLTMDEEELAILSEFCDWFVSGNYTTGEDAIDEQIETLYTYLQLASLGIDTGSDSGITSILDMLPFDLGSIGSEVDMIMAIWLAFIVAAWFMGSFYLLDSWFWEIPMLHILNKLARVMTLIILFLYVLAKGFDTTFIAGPFQF